MCQVPQLTPAAQPDRGWEQVFPHYADPEERDRAASVFRHEVSRRLRGAAGAPATKRCRGCQADLPLDAFHRDARAGDGLFWRCRSCHSAARRGVVRSPAQT